MFEIQPNPFWSYDPLIRTLVAKHPERVPPETVQRIRAQIESSREREAELDRLIEQTEIELKKRRQLADLHKKLQAEECAHHTISSIKLVVCDYYGVKPSDLVSQRRTADLTRPRLVTYYLSRELSRFSLPVIGKHLGGRDHTTVLSGCRKIERLIKADRKLEGQIAEIIALLRQKEAA